MSPTLLRTVVLLSAVLPLAACDSAAIRLSQPGSTSCDIPIEGFTSGGARDIIAALTNPPLAAATDPGAAYLSDDERVIGVVVDGEPLAVPHEVLFSHEVANFDDWGGRSIAVTYCPNTGSSLVFDRHAVGGAEFGVSGLLLHDNLIMYDRRAEESLWPQMSRAARCGPSRGTPLEMLPAIEMRWNRWRELHPDTRVVTDLDEGAGTPDARSSDERVLGIPAGRGLALPFEVLDEGAPVRAVDVVVSDTAMVVLWSREAEAAMAYHATLDGDRIALVVRDGEIVDEGTGSIWTVEGRAVGGPLEGRGLRPVETAYVAFRSAWTDFNPETRIWKGSD